MGVGKWEIDMHRHHSGIYWLACLVVSFILPGLLAACGGGQQPVDAERVSTLVAAALTATAASPPTPPPVTDVPQATEVPPTATPPMPTVVPEPSAAPTDTATPEPPPTQMQLEETDAYQSLPEKVLVSPASIIATPLQPASYLDLPPIPTGERVRVVARDNDGSFILVLHNNSLNWIPAITAGFIGNLDVPTVSEAPQGNCAGFLGAARMPGETWANQTGGRISVRSLIYRPLPVSDSPSLMVAETGQRMEPSSRHTLTTGRGEVLEFVGSLGDVAANSPITLQTVGLEGEPSAYQAVFTIDDCAIAAETLSSMPTQAIASVAVDDLPVWSEPESTTNTIIGQLALGDKLALTGSAIGTDGRTWWRILLPSGEAGWVEESAVNEEGCVTCVPVIPRTIVLRITSQVPSISRFVLIDAVRNRPITDLENGDVIILSQLPTRKLDVEAVSPGTQTESVLFFLDGQMFCANGRCLENVPPYGMAGDVNGDHYDNWEWSTMLGRHTITAVGCDQDNGQGNCGAPMTIYFTVTN